MTNLKVNTDAGKDILFRLQKEYGEGGFYAFFTAISNHAETEEDIVEYAKECEIVLKPGETKPLLEFVLANRYILDPKVYEDKLAK